MVRGPALSSLAGLFLAGLISAGPASAAGPEQLTPDAPQTLPFVSSYRSITPEQSQQTEPIFAPGGPALPVYLNRHGGTYFSGWDDSSTNTSSIVEGGSATVGDFPGSDTQWADVLTCVQEQFAAFNVVVTDAEPQEGNYIEAVVGGSPQELGMPYGVGGVAPIDPYDCELLDKAVVYAFADVYIGDGWGGGTRALCETVTQEVAHAMSLDHVLICEDPMTYLNGCGEKWFQDEFGTCGEYEPRDCTCNRPSQNSVQILMEILGPSDGSEPPPPIEDNEPPSVSLLSPGDDDVFEAETTIEIEAEISDDVGLTLVQLYWENNDILLSCPGQGGGWSCTQSGSTYTWSVTPGAGTRTFYALARDVAGNTTTSEEVTVWLTEDGQEPPEDTMLPDVALISPAAGAELQANSQIQVVATASDDSGIAQVALEWDYSDDVFGCPLDTQAVDCVVEGSTYTWSIYVGDGVRTFRARARDLVGNEVNTDDRSITLVGSPTAPPANDEYEDDDTWDQASPVSCGDQLDLIAAEGDDDWFRLEVGADQGARFSLGGEAAEGLSMTVSSGPFSGSVLADGSGAEVLELVPEVAEIGLKVSAGAGVSGAYTLDVTCPAAEDVLPPIDTDPEGGDSDGEGEPDDGHGDENSGDGDGAPADGEGPGPALIGGCSSTSTSGAGSAAVGLIGLAVVIGRLRRRSSSAARQA